MCGNMGPHRDPARGIGQSDSERAAGFAARASGALFRGVLIRLSGVP
jgi:hypothetical protein